MTHPDDIAFFAGIGHLIKREYFAALNQAAILSGIYSNPDQTNILKRSTNDVTTEACKHADALIAELNK